MILSCNSAREMFENLSTPSFDEIFRFFIFRTRIIVSNNLFITTFIIKFVVFSHICGLRMLSSLDFSIITLHVTVVKLFYKIL